MNPSRQYAHRDTPKPTEHDVTCPECGEKMMLRNSRFGWFYGCSMFPKCRAAHGAHPNGEPLGIPADSKTKAWRVKAHNEFDKLWNGPDAEMSRSEAYRWMIETLALAKDDAHIGKFSTEQCQQLIAALAVRDQLAEINKPVRRR